MKIMANLHVTILSSGFMVQRVHTAAAAPTNPDPRSTKAPPRREEINMPTLIVFCHLRWDFVFQRPQHLMTRLAKHYNILFVEEPVHSEGQAHLQKTAVAPNITVCRPHTAINAPGFHD